MGRYNAIEIEKLAKVTHGCSRGGPWFPSLISELCRRAGVLLENTEGLCPPKNVMDRL